MSLPQRKKYSGRTRRLLLAFDIGTTFSGISYSILDPGNVPEILPVTRFPSQEQIGGDSKIPTVIYYNSAGNPCAIGAETLKEGIEEDAEQNGWTQAKWFKLHLRPRPSGQLNSPNTDPGIPPLPPHKTVVHVFKDYMHYLHRCAREYISETHGDRLWSAVKDDIMYVLTHPNGWGGPQQTQMRAAATLAGFVANGEEAQSRITFVTEGEASLHFCLTNGLSLSADKKSGVMIVDAGGGTIDVTAYRKRKNSSFEEIAIPECHFQGAAYVTMRAKEYFTDLLSNTRFSQDIETLERRFDRNTKHVFRKDSEPHHIQFASHRERDSALNIRGGRLTLSGVVVAKMFEPSITCIVDAVRAQKAASHFSIKSLFLVGGFSASTWLFDRVREKVEALGITVSRPDTFVNKAVSNGAVSFVLDHVVTTRVSRLTYGLYCDTPFRSEDPEHQKRANRTFRDQFDGKRMLKGKYQIILPKNIRIRETVEFKEAFTQKSTDKKSLKTISAAILVYTGKKSNPTWASDDPGSYSIACRIEADTSAVTLVKRKSTVTSQTYYRMDYEVVLLFGLTELVAQIAWSDDSGNETRSPAKVVYAT